MSRFGAWFGRVFGSWFGHDEEDDTADAGARPGVGADGPPAALLHHIDHEAERVRARELKDEEEIVTILGILRREGIL